MIRILHVETATTICSVALSENGVLIHKLEIADEGYAHGEKLTVLIDQLLAEAEVCIAEINAVSVSSGPGSYTGLRIGVSTVKGLCYALNIPMIAVNTLYSFVEIAKESYPKTNLCALIDARRMEVFSLIVDKEGIILKEASADVLDQNSYSEFEPFVYFGDGASKMLPFWEKRKACIANEIQLSASGQVQIAYQKYQAQDFVDLAYFEPNYIKAFYQPTKTPEN